MLGLEQVAHDLAARRTVGIKPDEYRARVVRLDMRLCQRTADGRRIAVELRQVLPCRFLRLVIVRHGEGHQLVEGHFLGAVELDELRADGRQLEPLPHHRRGDAEAGGDFLRPLAGPGKGMKRLELVGGMHRLPHDVLGKADLARVLVVEHVAADRRVLGNRLLLRQKLERRKAASARHDLELAFGGGTDLQVLQQAVRLDAGGKLVDADTATGLAHIGPRGHQLRSTESSVSS